MKEKGYTNIPNYLMCDARLTGYDKLVYWVIKAHAYGKKNWAIPGIETLHRLTGISNKHISDHTKRLQECGYIKIIQRGGRKSNKYILLPLKNAPAGFVSTESPDAEDDSQSGRDGSHLTQDDSHLQSTQADKPPVATIHNGGAIGEELQGRNTSGKKETNTFNPEEEKKKEAAVELEKKPGSLSLQESETHDEYLERMTFWDTSPSTPTPEELLDEEFYPSDLIELVRSNDDAQEWSSYLAKHFLVSFREEYVRSEGCPYVLIGSDLTKAESQANQLVHRLFQYFDSVDDNRYSLSRHLQELDKFVIYAFARKKDWAYKGNAPVIGLLLLDFSKIVNSYERGQSQLRASEAYTQRYFAEEAAREAERQRREESANHAQEETHREEMQPSEQESSSSMIGERTQQHDSPGQIRDSAESEASLPDVPSMDDLTEQFARIFNERPNHCAPVTKDASTDSPRYEAYTAKTDEEIRAAFNKLFAGK
jgi:hypothetical protein